MKKYIILVPLLIIIGILSCQSGNKTPDDLIGKKALLKEKKEGLAKLKNEIKLLEDEILILDPPKDKPAVLVNTYEVIHQQFQRFVNLQGVVGTDDLVNASSETGGRIVRMYVNEGDKVRKGQLVAKVDMETLVNQISELETNLALATTVYERQFRLWQQEIGSEIQYLQAKTSKESLEKNLETLKTQLAKQYVYAPISGVVEKRFLKSGEISGPGSPIVQILNTKNLKVKADVPESYLGKLGKGDEVSIYFPAIGDTLREKITLLGRTIDPSNRTFEIEIEIPNKNDILKPNLLAEVTFVDLKIEDAIVIPVDFVLEEVSGKKYVYVTMNEGDKVKAVKKYVILGQSYAGNVVIKEGLAITDVVILEGARNIAPNDPVKVANQNKAITNG